MLSVEVQNSVSNQALDVLPEVLTIGELCSFLRISRPTVYELIHRNEIPCRRIGRIWRFSKTQLLEWLGGNSRGLRSRSNQ